MLGSPLPPPLTIMRSAIKYLPFHVCMALAALFAISCETTQNNDPPGITFQVLEHQTWIPSIEPDGTLMWTTGDPDRVGRKQVRIRMTVSQPTEITTTLVTFWPAGDNAAAETLQRSFDELYEPATSIQLNRFEQIPGAEDYDLCEAMYYMWTVNYKKADGQPGTFISQPRLIMPTRKLVAGEIEETTCEEPPGPGD